MTIYIWKNIFPVCLDLRSFLPLYIFIIDIGFFIFYVTDGDLPILATRLVYFWFILPFWTCWSKRPGSASRKCFFRKCVRIKWKYYKYPSNHCEARYWTKYQRKPMVIQLLQVKFLYLIDKWKIVRTSTWGCTCTLWAPKQNP